MMRAFCVHDEAAGGVCGAELVEQGKLDLDKALSGYLPEPYLKNEPLHEKITARMVLNHTIGFPNWRPKGSR